MAGVDRRVGIVGLGQMGSRMATRVLAAGYDAVGFDASRDAIKRMEAAGVRCVSTAQELGSQADVVLVSLPDGTASMEVLSSPVGLLSEASFGAYVELSTVGPLAAREIGSLLAARNIAMLDAPVSGGTGGAEKGTLTVMVSGPEEVLLQWRPLLGCIGRNIVHLGTEPGQGQMMKLINNLLESAALCITAEGMALGVKANLRPRDMVQVLSSSSGRNSATEELFPASVLPGLFNEGFALGLANKDLRLCLEFAESQGCPMWVGSAVRQWIGSATGRHGSTADFTTVVQDIEQWAGVEIREVARAR